MEPAKQVQAAVADAIRAKAPGDYLRALHDKLETMYGLDDGERQVLRALVAAALKVAANAEHPAPCNRAQRRTAERAR